MRAMLKAPLTYGMQSIALPEGAVVRHVHEQDGMLKLWFEGDPSPAMRLEHRLFRVFATGENLEGGQELSFVGTAHLVGSGTVWHVYEVLHNEPV